jgi:hypothetical protein
LDLDLCNGCHQSVGIPCILVYLLYVNEVSYLVGKPFIPLSSLSEKLCWSVLEISEDVHLFSVVKNPILFSYAARFARSVLMCGCILQMSENRRRGGRRAQQEQAALQDEAPQQQQLPPLPPMSIEQMFMTQTQVVQAIGQTLAAIQQQQPPPQPQMPQMPRDKRAEFMRGHPPMFAHSSDPMDEKDWLRTVERELHTAQCDDREKVLYGPRLLRGAAQYWWESYLATHANLDTITWEEFRDNFRQYHVPAGLMIVKKEEFLALKQGSMSVSEYRDIFLQLSHYAPEDVNTDAKRQYRFLRGLVDPLQYQLMNHTFPTFQHLIDRAIMTERKRKEMEDHKRKISGPQPGSSNRPRFSGNPPQQFRQNHRPPQQQQFQRQYPQHQHQNRQNNQSGGDQFQRQNQQAPRLPTPANQQNSQAAPVQGGNRAYFHCGEQGHWVMQCPKKAAQQQSGPNAPAKQNVPQPGADNRSQPRYNHGRLNHLEAETVHETPGMIVGMFPVDSHIAEVLFDTGAMHSFITTSWVEAHNLPITTMSTPIQIDSAGGRI